MDSTQFLDNQTNDTNTQRTLTQILEKLDRMEKKSEKHWKGETMPFVQYVHDCVEDKHATLSCSCYDKYTRIFANHIEPYFPASLMLTDVTDGMLSAFVAKMRETVGATSIIEAVKCIISPALDKAVQLGYIPRNVSKVVKVPKLKTVIKPALTDEQCTALFRVAKGHYQAIALHICFWLGLRREELLALTWDDIDLQQDLIYITKTVVKSREAHGAILVDGTKTNGSTRRVVIPPPLKKQLIAHRDYIQKKGSHYIIRQQKKDTYVYPDNFSRTFRRWLEKAGIQTKDSSVKYGLHSLRHTTVTNMARMGAPDNIIMEQTGHSDTRMLKRYTDPARMIDTRREWAKKMGERYSNVTA